MVDRAKNSKLARRLAIRWITLAWQAEIVVCLPSRHCPSDVLRFNDQFLFDHENTFSVTPKHTTPEERQNIPLIIGTSAPQNCKRRRTRSRLFRSRVRKQ
jgi:hypothetical protein